IAEAAGFKSRRTAIRACNRLEALGIIKQYETRRQGGDKRRSADIIVINAVEVTTSSDMATDESNSDTYHNMRRRTKHVTSRESNGRTSSKVTSTSHDKETPTKAIKLNNTLLDTNISRDSIIKRGLRNAIPKPIYN